LRLAQTPSRRYSHTPVLPRAVSRLVEEDGVMEEPRKAARGELLKTVE
jgi:hypothetical protein